MPSPSSILGDALSGLVGSTLDQFFKAIWNTSQVLLRASFSLADQFGSFVIAGDDGRLTPGSPLESVWPTLKWVAAVVALALFFVQVTLTAARGGRGMFRTVTGPLQFGMALATTVAVGSAVLAASDGLTTLLLEQGLRSGNFVGILDHSAYAQRLGASPDLGDVNDEHLRAAVMAVVALFGFLPAGFSFAAQMIFREAATLVLFATIPISAAGLLSDATASWFWRTVRWALTAALLKPALALVLVIGVNLMTSTTGIAGFIAGAMVLLISVFSPMTLYRLLAFVDPATGPGQAVRGVSQLNKAAEQIAGGDEGTTEAANTTRFGSSDAAGAPSAGASAGPAGAGGGAGGSGGAVASVGSGGAGSAAGAAGGAGAGAAAGGGAAGAGAGGAAAGGAAAGGAAAGGAAAGPAALPLLVKAAGQAAGGWAGNQMDAFGIGHRGSGRGSSGGGGGRGSGDRGSADDYADFDHPLDGEPDYGGRGEDGGQGGDEYADGLARRRADPDPGGAGDEVAPAPAPDAG